MEDGGALGYLFQSIHDPAEVAKRLALFELVRKARVSRIQILSSVRAGREKEVEQKVKQYADPPGAGELHMTSDISYSHSLRAQPSQLPTKSGLITIMGIMFLQSVTKYFNSRGR